MNLRKDHYRLRSLGRHAGASLVRGGILLKLIPGPRGGRGARAHPLPRISGGGRADSGPGRFGKGDGGCRFSPFPPHPLTPVWQRTRRAGGGVGGGVSRLSDGVPVSPEARLPRPAGVIHCRSRAPGSRGAGGVRWGRILPTPSSVARSPSEPVSGRCLGTLCPPRARGASAPGPYTRVRPPGTQLSRLPRRREGGSMSPAYTPGLARGGRGSARAVAFCLRTLSRKKKGLPQTKNKCTTLSGGSLGSCVDEERS